MKKLHKFSAIAILVIAFAIGFEGQALAATKVDLGAADSFAVLAGTPNITNVPPSVIVGNVGLSPASGSGIGLTCAEVTGTIYSVDAAGPLPCRVTDPTLLTTAKNNLTAAYLNAAGQTPTTTIPTQLGGTTQTPGIYTSSAGNFQITGTLTLDGQGDPNAVFIFQMASTLVTAAASNVVLTNGAQACNIFWQVGSSTGSLGTNSTFKGTVLALTSMNLDTGANVEGRVLARNGAVTLDSNTITRPTCLVASPPADTGDGSPGAVPGLPNAGIGGGHKKGASWNSIIPAGLVIALFSFYLIRKKLFITR